MKSTLKWGGLCLVVYFLFLIAKLPAAHILSQIQLPKEVSVSGVSGTIWNGHIQRAQANGLPVNDLNWSLSFFPLLLGEINADIKAGNIRNVKQVSGTGHIEISGQHIKTSDFLAYIPANLVITLLPLPVPVQADGRFKIQLTEFNYTTSCQTLLGQGQWLNANFTGATGTIDLGNFSADLTCQNNSVLIHVKEPNRFGLSAKATIPANMKFKIEGRFKPDSSLPKEVHQAANFFGKADADGYYSIKF